MSPDVDDKPEMEGPDNTLRKMTIMSKTTFKLRTFDDSEETGPDLSLELMEIPLSPTHYQAPPTPDHEPPNPFEAETRIQAVIDQIRVVRGHSKITSCKFDPKLIPQKCPNKIDALHT